ncbi:JAB domain-containing protein [Niallia sp. HCP3S3_B10]|nr:JAB domain-containing protein [Niallia sp. MER TA 168]
MSIAFSNDLAPSREDIEVTKRLAEAGKTMWI